MNYQIQPFTQGAPDQYPPYAAQGQYPAPVSPSQYPPPGVPGQYPQGMGEFSSLHAQRDELMITKMSYQMQPPTPGAPGQYPPPVSPGQYPPHGAPYHYPPSGMPGQHPPSSGFPVQHNIPPLVRTLSGGGALMPSLVRKLSEGGPSMPPLVRKLSEGGPSGWDADDSDTDDYVRTKHSKIPVTVKFVNMTNDNVKLYWLDDKGKFKKQEKIKEGRIEVIQTYESHPFCAEGKKGGGPVINGNFLFIPQAYSGSHDQLKAEITYGPKDRKSLLSKPSGHPVRMKFSNRTHQFITIKEIDEHGRSYPRKDIPPKKAWVVDTSEGRYFVACERGNDPRELCLNYGGFYLVTRPTNPQTTQKVLITEPVDHKMK